MIGFFLVDGGWTDWLYTTNNTCVHIINNIWGQPKHRNCSNPQPKWGGSPCNSNNDVTENLYDLCQAGKNFL
jgi:hypothetical protein